MKDFYNNLRDAIRARKRRERSYASYWTVSPATITTEGGSTTFSEFGNIYTWIFLHNHPSGKMAVINPTNITEDGTPVLVARSPKSPFRWAIIGPDTARVRADTQTASALGEGSPDIYQSSYMPLKTEGSSSLVVTTYPYIYTAASKLNNFSGVSTNLSSYVPGAGLTRKVLLYLDRDTKTLSVEVGGTVADGGPLPAPEPTPPGGINAELSALVTLTNGQTSISTIDDILDCRDLLKGRDTNIGMLPVAAASGQILITDETLNWIAATPVIDENGYWMTGDDDELVWE